MCDEIIQGAVTSGELNMRISGGIWRITAGPIYAEGCVDAQKTHWMASFSEDYPFKLIVTHSEKRATDIYEGYRFFDKNVFVYPARDIIFYSADVHGQALVHQRLSVVQKLLEREPVTVVTTVDGLMDSASAGGKAAAADHPSAGRRHMRSGRFGSAARLYGF